MIIEIGPNVASLLKIMLATLSSFFVFYFLYKADKS